MEDTHIIIIRDLVKKYKDVTAVDHVDLSVERGIIFALLGPNGAGKSTMIKILTTLLRPTSGSVIINGSNVEKDPDQARRSFGIVFQDPSLDDELTALENLEFHGILYKVPKKIRTERIETLLKMVELWDRRKTYVKEYSGGMKRRLEIARGFLHHPKILFLDEPTLGLDPQTRNLMWEYIKNLNVREKTTVFFTTHYMDEAERVSDRIAIVDHGKIIAQGSVADLKTQTDTERLEEAFLTLTGRKIREESGDGTLDRMRMIRRNR